MAEEKQQFDENLGGETRLIRGVLYDEFAESRIMEIQALTKAIEDPKHTGLVFQELPRHMRRRVMGHTTKRLPRKLREAHHNQLEKSGLLKQKKPNRKYKRRSQNLLKEFNRRQREFIWLETHIWHAKRFHMIPKWGYRIPNFPNDKSYRACYRASSQHCMLQDVSYLCCVELSGPLELLLNGLNAHTHTECGLTFASKAYLSGAREGHVAFYSQHVFPYGFLSNVDFLWKPPGDDVASDSAVRTLWLWVHPACHDDFKDELVRTYDLHHRTTAEVDEKKPLGKNVEKEKLELRNVPFEKTPKYENDAGVTMILLKDTLNRLRLTGPLSQSVLNDALLVVNEDKKSLTKTSTKDLQPIVPKSATNVPLDIDDIFASVDISKPSTSKGAGSDESMETDDDGATTEELVQENKDKDWWTNFYGGCSFHKAALDVQREFWKSLKETNSPAELPPNLVIGLTVADPRLYMPPKREKSVLDEQNLWDQLQRPATLTPPPTACASAIWNTDVRDIVTDTKPSVAELNASRQTNLIPGFVKDEKDEVISSNHHSRIPILLIQRPGYRQNKDNRLGLGSGWDLIVPAGWAMPFWMAFIFRCARPSGLREASSLRRETLMADTLEPDSRAARRENTTMHDENKEKYFRLPPAKRPNFIKLGIASPFSCNWDTLVREWYFEANQRPSCSPGGRQWCTMLPTLGPCFVLRDRSKLAALYNFLDPKTRGTDLPQVPSKERVCLVPVTLTMLGRGTPTDYSVICVPSEDDLKCLAVDGKYNGPLEPQHEDHNAEEREKLKSEHQKALKQQRRKRRKAKRKREEDTEATVADVKPESEPDNKEEIEQYRRMNRHLWIPEGLPVKNSSSRLTIGFVEKGDFSFSKACGSGIGYVPLPGLVHLLKQQLPNESNLPIYVLVRNTSSYQYFFAKLQVNYSG